MVAHDLHFAEVRDRLRHGRDGSLCKGSRKGAEGLHPRHEERQHADDALGVGRVHLHGDGQVKV
eukprot:scaffold76986_cov45-Phaeocystis_antarctica.AAC.1